LETKIEIGHEKGKTVIFEETVNEVVLGVSFTNRKLGDELEKIVTCHQDQSPQESHEKQVVKKAKWALESGGGISEEMMGIEITTRQIKVNGKQLLTEILQWAKRNGIENARFRLKLRKVSENSFKTRYPAVWTFKYKLKIYFMSNTDAKFPKEGTTVVSIAKLLEALPEPLDELLNAAFFNHIYFNRLPIPAYSIECVMRDPQAKSWQSLFLS
jgi:hypothetical protein